MKKIKRKKRKARYTACLYMRVSKDELRVIDEAAKSLGITRSALIRHAAEASAARILYLGTPHENAN